MKKLATLLIACTILSLSRAQTIQVTMDKTTSLIFPFSILHIDRGSRDVLVQPVKEAGNILLIKAATAEFIPTNISVVTSDGSVYSLPVVFTAEPAVTVYQLPAQKSSSVETYAGGILDNPITIHGIKDSRWDMLARVNGIYLKDDVMYYQLVLTNVSPVDYDIDLLRFYIRDKHNGRRTAVQENELKPLYLAGNTTQVKANGHSAIVAALQKFTIPDGKYLAVELMEKNGGRNLKMKVWNRKIMKAMILPDLK
ncbi:MAG: traN [Ferruginibacter sp.]|uniref:conjugative transposon protein TraN n=1 Tax=Ferruginibacter sp. TaxID=1940288 RepID=UPI0026583498|nr:conjugative transposon protein TraN [Ferruginibacter sp.]MDB5277925.1 traN [Ferruginibacter sp.]